MLEIHKDAFRAVLKLPRPTMRETLELASLYSAQAVVCVVVLKLLFARFGLPAVFWAIISSILALQPGWSQSVVTSVIRIVATLVGAGVALTVSKVHFAPELQLIVSLVIVVFICELLRLDLALRTACVTVVIVLSLNEGHVSSTAADRCLATILGCLMALLVQFITDLVWAVVRPRQGKIEPMKS